MRKQSSEGKEIKETRNQLNLTYKELIICVMNKFKELGITLKEPDTAMNPLRLSLMALEKDYLKQLKSL